MHPRYTYTRVAPQKNVCVSNGMEFIHAFGRVPERGDRVLRVVYNPTTEPVTVVTAYFDRKMRDKL